MLMFNWTKIYDEAHGSVDKIFEIFAILTRAEIPKNKYDPAFRLSQINFKGTSFLAHADVLLFHSYKYSKREIAQYISVAALRPVADYLATGKTWVEFDNLPFELQYIEDNRLLILDYDQQVVRFKYEEVPQEKH